MRREMAADGRGPWTGVWSSTSVEWTAISPRPPNPSLIPPTLVSPSGARLLPLTRSLFLFPARSLLSCIHVSSLACISVCVRVCLVCVCVLWYENVCMYARAPPRVSCYVLSGTAECNRDADCTPDPLFPGPPYVPPSAPAFPCSLPLIVALFGLTREWESFWLICPSPSHFLRSSRLLIPSGINNVRDIEYCRYRMLLL